MKHNLPLLLVALTCAGCTAKQFGAALIVAGAVTAVAASQGATRGACSAAGVEQPQQCGGSTTDRRRQKAAAAGVAAGVGLAAVGQALIESDRDGRDRAQSSRPPSFPSNQ